jgi:hypothetical protein
MFVLEGRVVNEIFESFLFSSVSFSFFFFFFIFNF